MRMRKRIVRAYGVMGYEIRDENDTIDNRATKVPDSVVET